MTAHKYHPTYNSNACILGCTAQRNLSFDNAAIDADVFQTCEEATAEYYRRKAASTRDREDRLTIFRTNHRVGWYWVRFDDSAPCVIEFDGDVWWLNVGHFPDGDGNLDQTRFDDPSITIISGPLEIPAT